MGKSSAQPEWSGDRLDSPEMMKAFTGQLRQVLSDQAAWLDRIQRDAVAMWVENPPPEYGPMEARRRHRSLVAAFAKIQKDLEAAAKGTFRLEARYRRNRHEVPAARRAALEERQQAAALPRNGVPPQRPAMQGRTQRAQPVRDDEDFMGLIQRGRSA